MYSNCTYLVTLQKIQPVPVGQYAKAHLLLFREQPISPKSHKAPYLKRDSPAQLSCLPRYRAGKCAPRAHARSCAWARWATTAARSAFSRAVAVARRGRYGGCNAARQLWHGALASVTCRGVCSAASTLRRLQHSAKSTVRRLWRGAVRRILRLCCARTLFPIKCVQRSRSM